MLKKIFPLVIAAVFGLVFLVFAAALVTVLFTNLLELYYNAN